jgi:chemotaxis signal transduction protein
MTICTAWILKLDGGLLAAVAAHEMIHLIPSPTLFEIAQTPYHCRQVLIWQDKILPAMDLAAWLQGHPVQRSQCSAGIVAYQNQPETAHQYGALLLTGTPARVSVSDAQACALPDEPKGWEILAMSCFSDGNATIPILDLPYIFSDALLEI